MGKSSPSAPPPPDYAGAAAAQGAANVETARVQGRMNNPNTVGPLGGQTVTWEGDQPTVTQNLTPDAQATLDAQQRVQRALAGLGEQGLGTASNVLNTAFNPNLAGLQTNVGNAGQISQAPDLSQYGQAGGNINAGQISQAPDLGQYGQAGANVNAQGVNYGPQAGQYGMARGGPRGGQYGYAGGGPSSGQYGLAGANVQTGAINQGPQAGDFGSAQGNVAAPQLQNQIDTSGVGNVNYGPQTDQYGLASGALNTGNVAAMPVNAGMTGQQAIMNRLAPQLERSDAVTRQRLINQGLVPGGEAYENAMISQNQQKNDLLSQAALQGIGLDTAANAQGFNQALQAGQFGNQAVGQNFSQAQAAQAGQNAAQNQAFGQRVQSGQFGNQAQLASFGAGMQNAGLYNSALNQNLNTALSTQQAQNAAQQQGYAQQMGMAGLQNQAIGQNFGQGVTAQQLQNQSIGQNFAQGQSANAAQNAAVGQNFAQGLSAQQAQNAAAQQLYNQYMGVQGLQNQAVGQNQQAALAQQQAALAAQQQGFGQQVTQQQLGNQAVSQNQQAALQQQQAALAAQNQQYNQLLQGAQFGNTAQQQSLAQQLALRNQPLNEISGLMAGSQIQMPQFQGYQGSNIAPAPVFAGAQAAGQSAMDRYGIQSSNVNAQNAGLYNLAGTIGGAAMFSDPRLKSNVVRVGTHRLGIGVYEYDIFGKRQRGVMADEVESVMPEAVALHPSGYKMVNYGMIN